MTDFHLPTDGSIIIVDDQTEDAIPIMKLLASKGIASTYYTGNDDTLLPTRPTQKVRLIFCDIELIPSIPAHSHAQIIAKILDRLISNDNGPYVLALWSERLVGHAETVQAELTSPSFPKRPLCVIKLEKHNYLETQVNEGDIDELLSEIDSSFEDSIEESDLQAIKEKIRQVSRPLETKNLKEGALATLLNDLNRQLKDNVDALQIFTIWESSINQSSKAIISDCSALYNQPKHWSDNIKHTVYRLARAQTEQRVDTLDQPQLLSNALTTLNQTFLDQVENDPKLVSDMHAMVDIDIGEIGFVREIENVVYRIIWNPRTKFFRFLEGDKRPLESKKMDNLESQAKNSKNGDPIAQETIDAIFREYHSIPPKLNTRLHADLNPSNGLAPGNVYEIAIPNTSRRRIVLQTYVRVTEIYKLRTDSELFNSALETIRFVELEVTPACDFSQNKLLKSRVLPGVLVPVRFRKHIKSGGNFYAQTPTIKFNGTDYLLIFDFRLFKSVEVEIMSSLKPLFRLRQELHSDIVLQLSNHVSRLGISVID
jgi:hypothetical protein